MVKDEQKRKIDDVSNGVEKKDHSVSRRSVLKGAVGLGAMAAAAGAVGLSLTSGRAEAAKLPKKWDKVVDVVVVGAGGAGLFAAIEAADAGAKTIFLESEPVRLGSTPISGGIYVACETDMQPGSRDELFADLMASHRQDCDPALVRAYVDNAGETYKRMKELGVKFTRVSSWAFMKKPWGHDASSAAEMCAALENATKKKGAQLLLNTRGKRLLVNPDNRVMGIEVESKGKKQYYKAKKGVVLATGGFTRNPELAKNFGRPGSEKIFPLTGIASRGDGLIMGWGLGSNMTYMTIGVGPTAPADKETGATDITFYSGSIIVNKNGKRFFRESEGYSDICWAGLQQPDILMIQIYDARVKKALVGTPLGNLMKGAKEYEAPTLAELGTMLQKACGMNAEAMVETVNKYNGYVDAGSDPEFGRKNLVGISGQLVKIDTPPFVALISVPGTTHFNGGLKVNPRMQVLDVYGQAIPGLYAAGEVTGGFHGSGYMSGSAVGMALIFGRIAGKNIAAEKGVS
jgi:fumarate reductase flavoprotein subunit